MALSLAPRATPTAMKCGHWSYWTGKGGDCTACEKKVPIPSDPMTGLKKKLRTGSGGDVLA